MTAPRADTPDRPTLRQLLARVHLRLILFAVLLAAACLMLSGGLVIRNYAQRNLDLVARSVAYTVEPAVVFGDRPAIVEGVASVAGVRDVARVEVRDPAGAVLADWTNPHTAVPGWLSKQASGLIWPRPVRAEVVRAGTMLAEVRITGNPEGLLRFILAGSIIALLTLALTILASRSLARRLQSYVVTPLEQVADVAHVVRRERTFDRRVPEAGIVEIDQFARDFNALLAELQGWHASIAREHAELAQLALQDPLTGLGNRAAFEADLSAAVEATIKGGQAFAVLYCDVDRFKAINDEYGHGAGDAVLVEIAARMKAALRQNDQAYRPGGDEFAILLNPAGQGEPARRVCERLSAAMTAPVTLADGQSVCVTLSVGVATYPDDGLAPADLLRRADRAMYREKRTRAGAE